MRLLQRGNKERTTEPTAANKTSSRSHALLIVNVKQTAKSRAQTKGAVKNGRLYMIDLAGSERAAVTEVILGGAPIDVVEVDIRLKIDIQ